MPVMVSTNCTMTSAAASRTFRYVREDSLRNHQVSATSTGNAHRQASPSRQSSTTSSTAVPNMVSTAVIRPSNPVASMSWMASTSLVERATTRPEV